MTDDHMLHSARLAMGDAWRDGYNTAAREVEQLRAELAEMTLWLVVNSNGGYIIEKDDVENFPIGRAVIKRIYDPVTGDTHLNATADEQASP